MKARLLVTALAVSTSLLLLSPSSAEDAPVPQPEAPKSTLDLEWESVDEASGYELKLTPQNANQNADKTAGEPLLFKTEESRISQEVPSGTYLLQIRSKEKSSGYWGPWSDPQEIDVVPKVVELREPKDKDVIPEPVEPRRDITLSWSAIPGVRNYSLRIWEASAEDKAIEFITANTSKTLKLATGHTYSWTVTVEDEKSVLYHTKPEPFSFTILGKQLLTPVIDTKISRSDVSSLRWEASPDAKTYRIRFENRLLDEETWRVHRDLPEHKETKMAFPKLAPGFYKLEVTAEAPHHVSSEQAKFEFSIKPSEAELAEKLAAARPD